MIKVAIADDQTLLRDMLKIMLVQDREIEVVACASNGDEAVNACEKYRPNLVLMDIRMPEVDGIDALTMIKRKYPEIKVIMLTTFEDENSIVEAYMNGADGYILKDVEPHVLVLAVKCIHTGLFVMHQSVHQFMIKQFRISIDSRISLACTESEEAELDRTDRAILRLLAEGCNNREIANSLNFSEGTVKNRISGLLSTTGLKDRTQLAVFALKNNII